LPNGKASACCILRAVLMSGKKLDSKDLLGLINRAINNAWPSYMSIIAVGKAEALNDLHSDDSGRTDPKT